jgi:hypothetical protein
MRTESYATHDTPEYVGTTLSFGDIDDVLLICHGTEAPTPLDWGMLLTRVQSWDFRVMLVSTEGGGPNHAQRSALIAALREGGRVRPPVAVLSASPRMRWAHAALQLVSPELEAVTLPFEAIKRARLILEFIPGYERVEIARKRAHYAIVKRGVARPQQQALRIS